MEDQPPRPADRCRSSIQYMDCAMDEHEGRMTIPRLLTLTAGAAAGLAAIPQAPASNVINLVLFAMLFAASGIACASVPMLLADRLVRHRTLEPASFCLIVTAIVSLIYLPLIWASWVINNKRVDSWDSYVRQLFVSDPGDYALIAMFNVWPLVAFSLFVAVLLGNPPKRWYLLHGYWANGLGLWVVIAWSIPSPIVVFDFTLRHLM